MQCEAIGSNANALQQQQQQRNDQFIASTVLILANWPGLNIYFFLKKTVALIGGNAQRQSMHRSSAFSPHSRRTICFFFLYKNIRILSPAVTSMSVFASNIDKGDILFKALRQSYIEEEQRLVHSDIY